MNFDRSKIHLVPISVIDVAENIFDPNLSYSQRESYVQRLETMRNYIDAALFQYQAKQKFQKVA